MFNKLIFTTAHNVRLRKLMKNDGLTILKGIDKPNTKAVGIC